MKIGRSQKLVDSLGPVGGVNAANYFQLAGAFAASRGAGFVVRALDGQKGSRQSKQLATEPQWIAWLDYLQSIGVSTKFMLFQGEATVPAEWPDLFDAAAPMADVTALLPRSRFGSGYRVPALFDRLVQRVSGWTAPKRSSAQPKTEEWLAEYGRQPLAVSEAMKAKIRPMTSRPKEAAE